VTEKRRNNPVIYVSRTNESFLHLRVAIFILLCRRPNKYSNPVDPYIMSMLYHSSQKIKLNKMARRVALSLINHMHYPFIRTKCSYTVLGSFIYLFTSRLYSSVFSVITLFVAAV